MSCGSCCNQRPRYLDLGHAPSGRGRAKEMSKSDVRLASAVGILCGLSLARFRCRCPSVQIGTLPQHDADLTGQDGVCRLLALLPVAVLPVAVVDLPCQGGDADEEAAEFHWVEVALRAALAVAGV